MDKLSEPTLVQTLRGHRGEVSCAEARGARLVTAGGDRALRLWRWSPAHGWLELAAATQAHRYGVTYVRWSSGGALIASGGVDGAVRVWATVGEGRSGRLAARRELAAPAARAVRALCWAGGARLAAAHDDGAVCLWAVRAARLLARLQPLEGAVGAVCAPARDALLLTACTNGVLKVFDMQEVCNYGVEGGAGPTPLLWLDGVHDLGALCADASEDGKLAATGGHDARIRLWAVRGRRVSDGGALEGHAAAVTCLRWAGGVLASASLDRTARLWAGSACVRVLHAHPRYLTCVALDRNLAYLITGSNDKTVRMWSLGSLTVDDELEPPCSALAHFALGDLEGIGPVEDQVEEASSTGAGEGRESGAACLWRAADAHAGAINCIATTGDLLATASSDGLVKIFRWHQADNELRVEHVLQPGARYPVMAADFGSGGAMLFTAGLDGQAVLWDVQSGCRLRGLCGPCGGGAEGVRGVAVSPHRPPLLLIATDDCTAPVWSLADSDPKPEFVYAGHTDAATCCAWSRDGRLLVTGSAAGELRLHTPPPAPRSLLHRADAHDLGVQSCDFSPSDSMSAFGLPDSVYLLATGGCDSLIKIWAVEWSEELSGPVVSLRILRQLEAHGGTVACVRWNATGTLLATGGADEWARVWDAITGSCIASVPAGTNGSALSVALLPGGLLAIGTLAGELEVWKLPTLDELEDTDGHDDDEDLIARFWGEPGVVRWFMQYVTRNPVSSVPRELEAELVNKVRGIGVTGAQLMDDPIEEILEKFGLGVSENEEKKIEAEYSVLRERMTDELIWLRRTVPTPEAENGAPHGLLCPISHRLMQEPSRAADGFTYERIAIYEWFLAAEGAISPMSGRRLRNIRIMPNYRLRDRLKDYLNECQTTD